MSPGDWRRILRRTPPPPTTLAACTAARAGTPRGPETLEPVLVGPTAASGHFSWPTAAPLRAQDCWQRVDRHERGARYAEQPRTGCMLGTPEVMVARNGRAAVDDAAHDRL